MLMLRTAAVMYLTDHCRCSSLMPARSSSFANAIARPDIAHDAVAIEQQRQRQVRDVVQAPHRLPVSISVG